MRRGLCVLTLCALTIAAPALGASRPALDAPRLTSAAATSDFLAVPKVRQWLDRYPADPRTEADFDTVSRQWTVHVWSGRAGEIATGTVEDLTGHVLEAWTGPQVAWTMARGYHAAFAGKAFSNWWVWGVCSLLGE